MMNVDMDYQEAVSITKLPITDPIHKPCQTMAGMEDYNPSKTQKARFFISELRKQHGIKKRVSTQRTARPLTYICTQYGCIESWGAISNVQPE